MKLDAAKLNKLRGMSLSEIAGRTQQEFAKLTDRLLTRAPLLSAAGPMNDEALYREFKPAVRNGTGAGTAERLLDRLRKGEDLFLPPLAERSRVVELMTERFPAERDAVIAIAEKAIAGKFDLLGYTDLDFGKPVNWHLDPRTGDRAPLLHWSQIDPVTPIGQGDLKVFWEINRTAHFVTLGQAYWLTSDDCYAAEFAAQVSSWIAANPAGMGIGWAASLDVALRAIQWLWALHLCAASPALTQDFVARLVSSLVEHGRHIEKYLSYYFSPNTHLTGEALGLFYLGVALPELRRAAGWRKLGLRILLEQLPRHVRDDGVYFEQSSYYHRYTADFYAHLFALIRAGEMALPREDERMLWQRLESLFEYLMWIGRPDGSWPLVGDDDGGRLIKFNPLRERDARNAPNSGDFRDTLAVGAAIYKRGDWKRMAGDAPAEMLWLLGPEGLECYDRLRPETPPETSRAFPVSGYFVMRDGWERNSSFALIDCGRHGSEMGSGHAHSDALSLELALRGATWLLDPATYVYGSDPETRDSFRSTSAHNTAIVDGQDQSVPADPFGWKTSASCQLLEFDDLGEAVVFEGSHDGYRRLNDPVTHTRSVTMLRQQAAFVVRDKFHARVRHAYAVRYHFAPDCEAETSTSGDKSSRRIEARKPDGQTLILNFFVTGMGLARIGARVEEGWVSTCYGQRTAAPIGIFEASGDGPVEIMTVIVGHDAILSHPRENLNRTITVGQDGILSHPPGKRE